VIPFRSWKLVVLEGGRTRLISHLRQRYAWKTPGSAILTLVLLEFTVVWWDQRGTGLSYDPGSQPAP
jgi:hypothetical protein